MLSAALKSLSAEKPQFVQTWSLSDRDFFTSAPHREHIWDVYSGLTKHTDLPASSALLTVYCISFPQLASDIALAR